MAAYTNFRSRKPRERKSTPRAAPTTPHEPGWVAYHAESIERRLMREHLDLLKQAPYHDLYGDACDRARDLLEAEARMGRLWQDARGRVHGPALAHVADLYGIDVRVIAPLVLGEQR